LCKVTKPMPLVLDFLSRLFFFVEVLAFWYSNWLHADWTDPVQNVCQQFTRCFGSYCNPALWARTGIARERER
jgi:hypothetical protein